MAHGKKPVSRKTGLVVQELNGEVLIYDVQAHKAYCLNETAALVWNACDGTRDVKALKGQLETDLRANVSDDMIWLALDQLKKEKLIDHGDEPESYFGGLSRREVIKKVGLGTMIALPIVASLVAPSAANAASCVGCVCDGMNATTAGMTCTDGGGGTMCVNNAACMTCTALNTAPAGAPGSAGSPGTCGP